MFLNKFFEKLGNIKWGEGIVEKRHTIMFVILALLFESMALVLTGNPFLSQWHWVFVLYIFIVITLSFFYGGRPSQIILGLALLFQLVISFWAITLYETTRLVYDYGMFQTFLQEVSPSEMRFPVVYLVFGFAGMAFYTFGSAIGKEPYTPYIKRSKGFIFFHIRNVIVSIITVVFFLFFVSFYSPESAYDYEGNIEGDTISNYSIYGVLHRHIQQWVISREIPPQEDANEVENFLFTTLKQSSETEKKVLILEIPNFDWIIFDTDSATNKTTFNVSEEKMELLFPNLHFLYNNASVFPNFHTPDTHDQTTTNVFLGNRTPFREQEVFFKDFQYELDIFTLLEESNKSSIFYYSDDNYRLNKFHKTIAAQSEQKDIESLSNQDYDFIYFKENHLLRDFSSQTEDMRSFFSKMDDIIDDDIDWTTHPSRLQLRRYFAYVMELDEKINNLLENIDDDTIIIIYGSSPPEQFSHYLRQENNKRTNDNVPLLVYDHGNPEKETIENQIYDFDITVSIFDLMGVSFFENFYLGKDIFSENITAFYSYNNDHYYLRSYAFRTTLERNFLDLNNKFPNSRIELYELAEKQKFIDQYYFHYGRQGNE